MLLSMSDEFSKNQSATLKGELVTATANLTMIKDGLAARDWGAGELVVPYVFVTSAADFNVGTSAKFDIVASTTTALTGSAAILSTKTYLTADLTAGTFHALPPLIPGFSRRYLGCIVTVAGGNATTGAVIVGLMHKDARRQPYGDLTGSL